MILCTACLPARPSVPTCLRCAQAVRHITQCRTCVCCHCGRPTCRSRHSCSQLLGGVACSCASAHRLVDTSRGFRAAKCDCSRIRQKARSSGEGRSCRVARAHRALAKSWWLCVKEEREQGEGAQGGEKLSARRRFLLWGSGQMGGTLQNRGNTALGAEGNTAVGAEGTETSWQPSLCLSVFV